MASSSRYTYEDFLRALEESGFGPEGFSESDMKLAQQNPDAGMSILNYKKDWRNATTDQARALANAGAERVRANYGGYTGGTDGSQFYLTDPSPDDFTFGREAPTYTAPGSFSYRDAPTYTNRYDERTQQLLNEVLSRPEFSYSAENDPLYSQYRKQYLREGQRASEDAMGQAAAMSGGLPSSYAATAAGQSRNYYNAQLTDKIPELEELAYQKYLDEDSLRRSDLAAVQNAEQADYQKYLGQLSQYNTDRNFAYGQYSDDRNFGYQQYLDQLSQYNADRNFAYGQYVDELGTQEQRQQDLWDKAQTAAQYGDYKGLNDLGVNTDGYISPQDQWLREMEYQRERDAVADSRYADEMAYQRERDTIADSRYADELAYERGRDALSDSRYADETAYQRERNAQADALDRAAFAAGYGDYSGLQGMGIDTSSVQSGQNGGPEQGYISVYDTMNGLGIETYEDAMAFLMSQGNSTSEAMELANNYLSVLESGRYTQSQSSGGGNGTSGNSGLHADQHGLINPGQDAPDRDRFLYAFTQNANAGTDPQVLADQLDVAVENGWITAEEAKSLKVQAQANYAMFFGTK